ncbi:hypothetical protein C664_19878 [Thauera sp. 63]|nr:hypothetical protein C664_19878 [Thauera sp. 63]
MQHLVAVAMAVGGQHALGRCVAQLDQPDHLPLAVGLALEHRAARHPCAEGAIDTDQPEHRPVLPRAAAGLDGHTGPALVARKAHRHQRSGRRAVDLAVVGYRQIAIAAADTIVQFQHRPVAAHADRCAGKVAAGEYRTGADVFGEAAGVEWVGADVQRQSATFVAAEKGRMVGGDGVAFPDQEGAADLAFALAQHADRAQHRPGCRLVAAAVLAENVSVGRQGEQRQRCEHDRDETTAGRRRIAVTSNGRGRGHG